MQKISQIKHLLQAKIFTKTSNNIPVHPSTFYEIKNGKILFKKEFALQYKSRTFAQNFR